MKTKRRKPMQVSVEAIIKNAGMTADYEAALCGDSDNGFHLAVRSGEYQKLVIEVTPDQFTSVAHVYIQHGDVMRDPEIVFNEWWRPIEITQSPFGIYRRVSEEKIQKGYYLSGVTSLADVWAKNLRAQGFTDVDAEFSSLTSDKFDGGA